MTDWQFRLEFRDLWKDERDGKISLLDVSKGVVERIKALAPVIRKRKDEMYQDAADDLENDILPMFEELVEEENEDTEDFDFALSYLYDWADGRLDDEWNGKKVCWVNTL